MNKTTTITYTEAAGQRIGWLPAGSSVVAEPNKPFLVRTVKPGARTSEFWTTLITNLVAVVLVLWPEQEALVQALAILAIGIVNGLYATSRAYVKGNN